MDKFSTISRQFIYDCNSTLEKEKSAYRFVNKLITPITSDIEIQSIEKSIENADQYIGVRTHLETALRHLSDRIHPDYRNSIKESISAVDSLAKIITGDQKATLGKALKVANANMDNNPKVFDVLHDYEIILRQMIQKKGMGMPDDEDASKAIFN